MPAFVRTHRARVGTANTRVVMRVASCMMTPVPASGFISLASVRAAALSIAVTAGAASLPGCGDPGPEPASSPAFVADQTYTQISGVITVMPDPARPINGLTIAHEHIPDFRGRDGEVYVASDGTRGMRAMTMEFTPAPGVSLDGFQTGDAVLFGFEVDWDGDPHYRLHVIEHAPEAPSRDGQTGASPRDDDGADGADGG